MGRGRGGEHRERDVDPDGDEAGDRHAERERDQPWPKVEEPDRRTVVERFTRPCAPASDSRERPSSRQASPAPLSGNSWAAVRSCDTLGGRPRRSAISATARRSERRTPGEHGQHRQHPGEAEDALVDDDLHHGPHERVAVITQTAPSSTSEIATRIAVRRNAPTSLVDRGRPEAQAVPPSWSA